MIKQTRLEYYKPMIVVGSVWRYGKRRIEIIAVLGDTHVLAKHLREGKTRGTVNGIPISIATLTATYDCEGAEPWTASRTSPEYVTRAEHNAAIVRVLDLIRPLLNGQAKSVDDVKRQLELRA